MATYTQEQLDGATVEATDGSKIGKVSGVFLDVETEKPEWVVVKTGMFGSKEALIPIAAASIDLEAGTITVPFSKDTVKDAPHHDPDTELSQQDEAELFSYYKVPYGGETVTATGAPQAAVGGQEGRDTPATTTDDAMTRSEEQLHVGTRQVESGRVRLRKYVVTENVTTTVPVSHEEVRLEREPITEADAGTGAAISEEEREVTLRAEVPVVEKETVPVERVRLGTETVTEQAQVDETVRKEQIETDTDADRR